MPVSPVTSGARGAPGSSQAVPSLSLPDKGSAMNSPLELNKRLLSAAQSSFSIKPQAAPPKRSSLAAAAATTAGKQPFRSPTGAPVPAAVPSPRGSVPRGRSPARS